MKLKTNIPPERLLYAENGAETTVYRKGDKIKLRKRREKESITGTIHSISDASLDLNTCGLGALAIIMFCEIAEIEKI